MMRTESFQFFVRSCLQKLFHKTGVLNIGAYVFQVGFPYSSLSSCIDRLFSALICSCSSLVRVCVHTHLRTTHQNEARSGGLPLGPLGAGASFVDHSARGMVSRQEATT